MSYQFAATDEMTDFAERISKEYRTLPCGIHSSVHGEYCIRYLNSDGNITARIVTQNRNIEIFKNVLVGNDGFNENFVFWLIMWCIYCSEIMRSYKPPHLNDPIQLTHTADNTINAYYNTTNRSKVDLLTGFESQARLCLSKEMVTRLQAMIKYFDYPGTVSKT